MKFKYLFSIILLIIALVTGIIILKHRNLADTNISTVLQKSKLNFPIKSTNVASKPKINHVFIILEENHDWSTIYNNPDAAYINTTLTKQGAYARNYHNVPESLGSLHPSELNYIFLDAGMITFPDHKFSSDEDPSAENSTASTSHLVSLLDKKGLTWKAYQEDISGNDCPINSVDNYAPKHNPMIFFQDVSGNPPSTANQYCKEHIRPFSELQHDLATNNVPNYVFITPNLNNDMHNGSIKQADIWLSQIVPQITNSQTFKKDGALFITWDEGAEKNDQRADDNKPIGMIILSPFAKQNYTNNLAYSHASLIKTIQEIFGLSPLLGLANDPQTQDLSAFFQ